MILTPAQQAFLNEVHYGVVGTHNRDGSIQQTVVWFMLEDDVIRFGMAAHSVKARNLRRNPGISLAVPAGPRYLTLRGTAQVEPPDPDMRYRIAVRYLGQEKADEWIKRPAPFERLSVRMRIERVYGQGV